MPQPLGADVPPVEGVGHAEFFQCGIGPGLRVGKAVAQAVTQSTRPPADTMDPPSARVPLWKTLTPGSASAAARPSMGMPLG